MQVLSTSILATNRLWAILFPHQLHLWRGRRLVLTVVIQFLPGIVASLPILSYEVSLKESRNGGLIPLITKLSAIPEYGRREKWIYGEKRDSDSFSWLHGQWLQKSCIICTFTPKSSFFPYSIFQVKFSTHFTSFSMT
nr:7TM GPCR domain containing protein [Haemonchus contortus]